MTVKTTAEKIADLFGDGQTWIAEGRKLDEVCAAEEGWSVEAGRDCLVKWLFDDGSSIVVAEGGWDLGLNDDADCFCWQPHDDSGDHENGCSLAEKSVVRVGAL